MKTITNILFLCGIIMFTAFSCEKDKTDNNMKSQVINKEEIIGEKNHTINI
ncbi:unnamed protein product, partial [marine sediment metagenome]